MKLIHTGDIHLGSAMRNLPPDKASVRKMEIIENFRRLTVYARENKIGAVLIAGDLFDEGEATESLKKEIAGMIRAAAPVCFFYISGNHDDEFSFADRPENLYLFSDNHGWKSYDLQEGVTLTGIDERNMREGRYSELALREERLNIVMMHGKLAKGEGGNGEISLFNLQNKNIDYLALGHIHQPTLNAERLDGRGHYRYCGCLEGRGFDECGKRGFFLLEIEGGKLRSETFVSLSKREICERAADISACTTYYDVERVADAALATENRENIVKLCLKGRHTAGLKKDIPLLTARLNQRFFFVKVVDESHVYVDYKQFEKDLSERGEFVRELGRYEMNEDFRAEILDVGLKALAGEEIDL